VPTPRALLSLPVAAGVAFALALAACGGGGTTAQVNPTTLPAQTVTLFAAASMSKVMPQLITEFENRYQGVSVEADYEGTQALLTKLEADPASADVFLSADLKHMATASQQGLVDPAQNLAGNRLVVVLPPGNPAHITALADLARSGVHLDLADTSVPAGAYAEQALHSIEAHGDAPTGYAARVLANVASRESDVEQVVTKVASGVVDAGVVYATDAQANPHLGTLPIPAADQPATVYPVALTRHGATSAGARAFLDFLLGTTGQHILRSAGFTAPPPPSPPASAAAESSSSTP